MPDNDDFLVTRRGRAAFVAFLFASLAALDATIAGLAALVVLSALDFAAPDLLQGPAPAAATWRIAAVLAILEVKTGTVARGARCAAATRQLPK